MTTPKKLTFLLVLCLKFAYGLNTYPVLYENLAKLCLGLGKNYVTISRSSHRQNQTESSSLSSSMTIHNQRFVDLMMELQRHFIRGRVVPYNVVATDMIWALDSVIFLEDNTMGDHGFDDILEIVVASKIRTVILVIEEIVSPDQVEQFKSKMATLGKNGFYYLVYLSSEAEDMVAKSVITLNDVDDVVISGVELDPESGRAIQEQSLQGVKLVASALSWDPFLVLQDCDEFGKNCTVYGYLADLFNALGSTLNFTWTCQQDNLENNWGVRPVSGPFNRSGVWTGAMGNVVNGKFMLGMSAWVWTFERADLLNFIAVSKTSSEMAFTPQPPEVDTGLFLRPFHNEAWYGCGVIMLIVLVAVLVPYAAISYYEHTDSYMVTSTTGWYFFVLVNAYYGGALTMFFSSEIPLPFATTEDVMRAYPEWKLKMQVGLDVYFQSKAREGDPLYSAFWDRVQNQPTEATFPNFEVGLEMMAKERTVLFSTSGVMKGFFHKNQFITQTVIAFGKDNEAFTGAIVPYNSPIQPFLENGIAILMENGLFDYLSMMWIGREIRPPQEPEAMVLTLGQMILIFLAVVFFFGLASVVLFCEICRKKLEETFGWGKQKTKGYHRHRQLTSNYDGSSGGGSSVDSTPRIKSARTSSIFSRVRSPLKPRRVILKRKPKIPKEFLRYPDMEAKSKWSYGGIKLEEHY